ncbi:hypothetical protein GGF50DRAFT_126653 [Schizophyllum commune]
MGVLGRLVALSVLGLPSLAASLAPLQYTTIPLGSVKPKGWIYDQLIVQMNGLAGHEHEFYDLDWIGGNSFYSYLEEGESVRTFFDGLVPSAVLTENEPIKEKTLAFLNYVLDHQDESGWLGPEVNTTKPRYLWGRYPFFFGAIQLLEVNPSLTDRVVTAMHKFVVLAHEMLVNGEGVDKWAATRWEDFVVVLQWLYDNYPRGQEELLIDTMKYLKWTGIPWEQVFTEELFPKNAVENLTNPFEELAWHGVNMAEGLKALGMTYRFTHNTSDLDAASTAWELVFKYHGRPSGIFAADEMLAGLEANRGTELCLVVETMLSGTFLYTVSGDPKYADRVERITYNALPATLTGDMWGRQYLQQQNQISVMNMTPNPFPSDGPESNIFGLEPNYPCCTVAFPKGWPKFVANAFMVTPDLSSMINVYLGPFETSTVLAGDNHVTVTVDTQYPFSDVLTTTIVADKPFTYKVRIASWVEGGTITVNGAPAKAVSPVNGLQSVEVSAGKTVLVLDLPAPITVEQRPHSAVALQRGPLHYAYDIPRTEHVLAVDPHEHRAIDLQMEPAGEWAWAIDPTTAVFRNEGTGSALPSPIFDFGRPPMTLQVQACPIDWPLAGDIFAAAPPENASCTGPERTISLSPYGATKLRVSEFPTLKSSLAADVEEEGWKNVLVEQQQQQQQHFGLAFATIYTLEGYISTKWSLLSGHLIALYSELRQICDMQKQDGTDDTDPSCSKQSGDTIQLSMALYEQHRVQQCLRRIMDQAIWEPDDTAEFDCMHYDGDYALDRAVDRLALPSGAHILDIGAGYGSTGRYLHAEHGLRVTGLELQKDIHDVAALINARQAMPANAVRAVQGDILDDATLPYLDAQYDGAVSFLTILHISDRAPLFARLAALVRPGGRVYIEDYVRGRELTDDESTRLAKIVACPYLPDRSTYRKQVRAAGFRVLCNEDVSATWKRFTRARAEAYVRRTDAVPSMATFYDTVAELFTNGAVEGMCLTLERRC